VYLDAIAYSVGAAEAISTLEPMRTDAALLELLYANGLRDYRRAAADPPALAAAALAGTLRRSGLHPRQIDAVVWSSTSFQERPWYTTDVSATLGELGLATATPYGVTLSECGNLAAGLRIAAGLIATGCRHVLFTTADCCPSPHQRLVQPSVAVLSDGAASCLLTTEPRGFELMSLTQCTNHRARPAPGSVDAVRLMRHNAEGVRRASRGALESAGMTSDAVAQMIPNNLSRTVLELFAAQAGIPLERVFTGNVLGNSHVFAADGLINLASSSAGAGEARLLVTNGTCNWGAAVVRATADIEALAS
jgi:3-oxoacyl-[acyl-carrier-protein] synthase-3